jgi:hypothetical protein
MHCIIIFLLLVIIVLVIALRCRCSSSLCNRYSDLESYNGTGIIVSPTLADSDDSSRDDLHLCDPDNADCKAFNICACDQDSQEGCGALNPTDCKCQKKSCDTFL